MLTGSLLFAACSANAHEDDCGIPAAELVSSDAGARVVDDAPPFPIQWLGDTLLADAAQGSLDERGYEWPFEHLLPLLDGAAVIANAEGPITTLTEPYDRKQPWTYNAQPEAGPALATAGVSAVSLANNHAMDRGPEGLADTTRALESGGIEVFGGGPNRAAALRPLLIKTPHGTVAVVGLAQGYGARKTAAEDRAGTLVAERCTIREAASEARAAGARWLVGFVHWGSNYSEVQHSQEAQARFFAEAGYDLVIGHGPHVEQPVASIGGMPVLYSLGNFVFGTPGRFSDDFPGYGVIATTELVSSGFERIRLRCIRTDNDFVRFQPRLCSAEESAEVLTAMHPGVRLDEAGGTLALPLASAPEIGAVE